MCQCAVSCAQEGGSQIACKLSVCHQHLHGRKLLRRQPMGRSGRSGAGGGNSWNSFQHSHAGQGYSSSQMSAIYHASGASHSSGSDSAAVAPYYGSSYNQPSSSYSSYATPVQPSYHAPSTSQSSSNNSWNQFQHSHAGQGWSQERMQTEYHSTRDLPGGVTPAASSSSGLLREHYSKARQTSSAVVSDNSSNAWNAFQQQNSGKGWTKKRMAQEYHRTPATPAASATSEPQSRHAWNQFQHEHGGKGWSKQQMQQEYQSVLKAEKAQGSRSHRVITSEQMLYRVRKSITDVSPAAAAAERQPLSWNDFQHAHAGAGWTKAELSAAYDKAKALAPAAAAETLNWNAFQHSNFGRHWSRQKMSEEYQAARQHAVDLRQQSTDVQKHSEWNTYLHRHKGQGWTQARSCLFTCVLHRVLQDKQCKHSMCIQTLA